MEMQSIGAYLREGRREKGLTQRDLGALLQVDHTYISKVENGHGPYPPSVEYLRKACQLLDLDLDWALSLSGRIPEDVHAILVENPDWYDELRTKAA